MNRKETTAPQLTLETLLEGKIRQTITVGGKTAQQLERELDQSNINVTSFARTMLLSPDFTTVNNPQEIQVVKVGVGDLGLDGNPKDEVVYARAQKLGLELCPHEVGPLIALDYLDQPGYGWFVIGMKKIADRHGYPRTFSLIRSESGLWLNSYSDAGSNTSPNGFVFSIPHNPPIA